MTTRITTRTAKTASPTTETRAATIPAWLARRADITPESSMDYLARHSHSFRYAARFLPPPYDELVADVYAFCRFTDDLVDGDTDTPPDELRVRLQDWKRLAAQAHAGIPCGIKLLDKPLLEMGRRGIPFPSAGQLIAAMQRYLHLAGGGGAATPATGRRYGNLATLDVYGYRVASVVGLWLTRLVGVHDERVLARAAELGQAMQLTNILRDVGEDWRNGRLYLPLDALERHGITEADIARAATHVPGNASPGGEAGPHLPQGWPDLMEELMKGAEARYERAFEAIPELPVFFRSPVAVSGMVYRDIHTAIRRNGYDNFTRRARTSAPRKLWLGAKARLWLSRARAAPRPAAYAPRPSAGLALALVITGFSGLATGEVAGAATAAGIPDIGKATAAARAEISLVDAALRAAGGDAALRAAGGDAALRAAGDDAALRAAADNTALHLRRVRALHTLSVEDEDTLPAARRALTLAMALTAAAPAGRPEASAVWLGYQGAFDVVEARHAVWPPARLRALRRGLDRLDEAVRRAPDDVEVRYLRLTSTYYLPALFGRGDSVREDFKALAELLPAVSGAYPSGWYVPLTDFVLGNAPLTAGERDRLRHARAQAASQRLPARG